MAQQYFRFFCVVFTCITLSIGSCLLANVSVNAEDEKVFISSYVRICILQEPKQGQKGWQPRKGVKIVTEEEEEGITGDVGICSVNIPVYNKEPLELIKVKIAKKTYEVPTFGPKEGIRGDYGSVFFSPQGKMYLSINTCPDVYDYLKEKYGFDVHPYDKGKELQPDGECRYPD